jgi:hypothetical protein
MPEQRRAGSRLPGRRPTGLRLVAGESAVSSGTADGYSRVKVDAYQEADQKIDQALRLLQEARAALALTRPDPPAAPHDQLLSLLMAVMEEGGTVTTERFREIKAEVGYEPRAAGFSGRPDSPLGHDQAAGTWTITPHGIAKYNAGIAARNVLTADEKQGRVDEANALLADLRKERVRYSIAYGVAAAEERWGTDWLDS